ncbi:MAG: hypothetical protein R2749_23505 [Acidimicrobiales bacterium]
MASSCAAGVTGEPGEVAAGGRLGLDHGGERTVEIAAQLPLVGGPAIGRDAGLHIEQHLQVRRRIVVAAKLGLGVDQHGQRLGVGRPGVEHPPAEGGGVGEAVLGQRQRRPTERDPVVGGGELRAPVEGGGRLLLVAGVAGERGLGQVGLAELPPGRHVAGPGGDGGFQPGHHLHRPGRGHRRGGR